MRRFLLSAIVLLLISAGYAQSGPELDALMEVVSAKDVPTVLRHLPPELGQAIAQMSAGEQRQLAEEFLIAPRMQKEGIKVVRPENGPVLVLERSEGDQTREEAEIYLDRRLTDGEETLLRFRIEPKNGIEEERDVHVSIGMRFVDDEWRVYEIEGGEGIRLDDPKLLDRFARDLGRANEASAVGSLRTLNTALITYSAAYPDIGFPNAISSLAGDGGSPDHAGLIDNVLGSPPYEKSGYRFTYQRTGQSEYAIVARPVEQDGEDRSFFTDESGVIRFTNEERDATAQDPPLH